MIKTRDAFAYYLGTGRDLLDDLQLLKQHRALMRLGEPNEFPSLFETIGIGLEDIGVEFNVSDIVRPTIEKETPDFIIDDPHADAMDKPKRNIIPKLITEFIISGDIRSDVLLDAPLDTTMEVYSNSNKERNRRNRARR